MTKPLPWAAPCGRQCRYLTSLTCRAMPRDSYTIQEDAMPLDPQAQAFLEQLAASGAPPLHELSVAEARQIIVTLFGTTDNPEPVGAVEDRTIAGAAGEMPARIY